MKLTQKQNEVLALVREYVQGLKENPTSYRLHKYMAGKGVEESMKSLMQVIEALEKKDLIMRDESKKLYLVENENFANASNIFSIPLYGLASCGEALAYADDSVADDFLQLSKNLFYRTKPERLFAVKALGDSMNLEGINDGDYVIFEKTEGSEDYTNRIVVVVINGMATIKHYKKVGDGVIGLFPHSTNKNHHPIFVSESDTVFVAGIFKKVLPVKFVSL